MICIRCGHDSKYRERTGRVCPGCRKQFAFEPRGGDKLTDKAFQNAIDRVSAGGKIRWGVEHLYYEVARRMKRVPGWGCAIALGIMGVLASLVAGKLLLALGVAAAAAIAAGLLYRQFYESPVIKLSKDEFNALWTRWVETHGMPKGVITRPKEAPAPKVLGPDLPDYSFDRAVICDRARTVDILLANNFHFENNCAVLAMNGYPKHVFGMVKAMLLKNPKLEVFVLHDATTEGCLLAHKLRNDPEWFKGRGSVIDVGLRPSHAGRYRKLYLESERRVSAEAGLTEAEAAWLSKYRLELAAIRPERLLKRLFKGISLGKPEEQIDSFG